MTRGGIPTLPLMKGRQGNSLPSILPNETDRPTESLRSPLPPLVRGLSHNTTALRCPSALSSSSAVSDRKGGSRVESRMNIPLFHLAAAPPPSTTTPRSSPPRSSPDSPRQLDARLSFRPFSLLILSDLATPDQEADKDAGGVIFVCTEVPSRQFILKRV